MKAHRMARIAEVVREVASETILFEMRDPRVKKVTVTRTEVSADLQHAKVYVSIMGTEKDEETTLRALTHAAGFIQSRLGDRLRSRFTPMLHFVLDRGVKQSIEISRLINEAKAQNPSTDVETDVEPDLEPEEPAEEAADGPADDGHAGV